MGTNGAVALGEEGSADATALRCDMRWEGWGCRFCLMRCVASA